MYVHEHYAYVSKSRTLGEGIVSIFDLGIGSRIRFHARGKAPRSGNLHPDVKNRTGARTNFKKTKLNINFEVF